MVDKVKIGQVYTDENGVRGVVVMARETDWCCLVRWEDDDRDMTESNDFMLRRCTLVSDVAQDNEIRVGQVYRCNEDGMPGVINGPSKHFNGHWEVLWDDGENTHASEIWLRKRCTLISDPPDQNKLGPPPPAPPNYSDISERVAEMAKAAADHADKLFMRAFVADETAYDTFEIRFDEPRCTQTPINLEPELTWYLARHADHSEYQAESEGAVVTRAKTRMWNRVRDRWSPPTCKDCGRERHIAYDLEFRDDGNRTHVEVRAKWECGK